MASIRDARNLQNLNDGGKIEEGSLEDDCLAFGACAIARTFKVITDRASWQS